MGQPRGIRLRDEDERIIEEISKKEGIKISTVVINIVHRYLKIERSKRERGDITLAGEIVKNRHNSIKKSDIPKIIEKDAKYIINEMELQTKLDFEEVARRITEWNNDENQLRLVYRKLENMAIFNAQHNLGKTWSEIQCKMYCRIFEKIKNESMKSSINFITNNSFQFEITLNKNLNNH